MNDFKLDSLINIYGDNFGQSFGGNVWNKNGLAPTLKSSGAVAQNFVVVKELKNEQSDCKVK